LWPIGSQKRVSTAPPAPRRAHGQQRDLVVEVDEAFDDHAAGIDAPARRRVPPGRFDVAGAIEFRLALARRGHDRLDHVRKADLGAGGFQLVQAAGEAVGRGGQAQFFGGQAADAFAVHGQLGGARGRDAGDLAGRFQFGQLRRGDRLDFGHDQVRPLLFDQRGQRRAVGHVDHVGAVRDLVAGRVG
jgi:hypothetical protein